MLSSACTVRPAAHARAALASEYVDYREIGMAIHNNMPNNNIIVFSTLRSILVLDWPIDPNAHAHTTWTHVHARVQPRGRKSARNWWDLERTRLVLNSKIVQIMSGRGRGVSGTQFRDSQLPLAPRMNTGPYVRPNSPTRLPPSQPGNGRLPDSGNSRSDNDRFHHQTRTNNDGSD